MLGHELRNPLGAITNAAHLLGAPGEETRERARAVIGRQAQHLARITDDLLDAARATAGKIILHRQPLELAEAAARVLATLRDGGAGRERRFEPRLSPVWVNADPTRVEQILGNLIGNALKFTAPGGTITVAVGQEDGEAVLRVSDDGVGLSTELARRVFEPFVQGERPIDRAPGGLGIGLTLVRRLAELHGGSATVKSAGPDRGSEFTVRFPAMSAPAPRGRAAPAPPAQPRDVLVVEDNDDAREMLQRLLEMDGHRVRVAHDGAAGLSALLAQVPEIAFIDVGLPEIDGYELARRVRAELGERRPPILVAITGYGQAEDRKRTREAGFDEHLVKPVDYETLSGVLRG
jgi:CheY-like chemotaxis protein/two-component sensor histidine kinase